MEGFVSFMNGLNDITAVSAFLRLFLAVVFGGVVGIERRQKRRAAGMRTHILVCLGAALVMVTNQYIFIRFAASDPTRLGAQVISGIGFLGVGTIIVDRHQQVRGLTTAAGLWSCACMGLALGCGFYSGATMAFLFIVLTETVLNNLENTILSHSRRVEVYTEFIRYSNINEFVVLAGEHRISIMRLEIVQPRGYSGKDDSRSAALITLLLPKRCLHATIIETLGCSAGLIVLEDAERES